MYALSDRLKLSISSQSSPAKRFTTAPIRGISNADANVFFYGLSDLSRFCSPWLLS
jgi:hypothetical protein